MGNYGQLQATTNNYEQRYTTRRGDVIGMGGDLQVSASTCKYQQVRASNDKNRQVAITRYVCDVDSKKMIPFILVARLAGVEGTQQRALSNESTPLSTYSSVVLRLGTKISARYCWRIEVSGSFSAAVWIDCLPLAASMIGIQSSLSSRVVFFIYSLNVVFHSFFVKREGGM